MANNNLYTFSTARSPILDYHKIKEYFINSIEKCNKEIIVCSAYIKIKGINWLYDNIKNLPYCERETSLYNNKYLHYCNYLIVCK